MQRQDTHLIYAIVSYQINYRYKQLKSYFSNSIAVCFVHLEKQLNTEDLQGRDERMVKNVFVCGCSLLYESGHVCSSGNLNHIHK